ncbi:MAG TPA: hypothetical protein VGG39_25375 [Polyangiaceae bacterium]|jgi:hypothetical protein
MPQTTTYPFRSHDPAPGPIPTGILARVPLPPELVRAIASAVEASERAPSATARKAMTLRTRTALDAWLSDQLPLDRVLRALQSGPVY